MSEMSTCWDAFFGIGIGSAFGAAVSLTLAFWANCALAQSNIVPDNTLGAESSVVTPNVVINDLSSERISGGAIRGTNLFHSFREFNVDKGRGAYFTNPAGIENILSRVTGGNASEILGRLGVLGNANLFLINPNGIIFGQNASLDVRGSFVASTASSLNFADSTKFSTTTSQTTPLLTISVPIGLQFGGNAGSIRNQSQAINSRGEQVGLQVQPGKTLALVGGEVTLEGGRLTTPGGRIELGSVANSSVVTLNPTNKGWILGYEGIQNFQNIQLSQGAVVDASGRGGDIHVQGKRITITDGSQMAAKTLGSGGKGSLAINASEEVVVSGESVNPRNFSRLTTGTEGAGAAGNLTITTGKLAIRDGAQVSAGTLPRSTGNGGNLTVNASNSVEVSGASANGKILSRLTTRTEGGGNAGALTITTEKLIIQGGGQVSAGSLVDSKGKGSGGSLTVHASDFVKVSGESVKGEDSSRLTTRTASSKDAGDLTINTGKLIIDAGGQVSSGTLSESTGAGGTLNISASDFVEVSGASATREEFSRLTTRTEGDSAAGDLTITTGKLIIRDGGQVSSGTDKGSTGAGGSLTVNASDSVEVSGFTITPNAQPETIFSRLTTRTWGEGSADNLTINTRKLAIRDGGQVSAGTVDGSTGNGGNLTVNASISVQVVGKVVSIRGISVSSRLTNRTENENATGNLKITTGELIVQDEAEVGVNSRSLGSGQPGNLEVTARSILLDNGATLNARAASVDGGSITLQIKDLLLLRRNSQISATAGINGSSGNGGNIIINAPDGFIVAVPDENSDIAANAYTGKGGKVEITAQSIFGLTPRSREELQTLLGTKDSEELNPANLPSSDITAISRTNPSLSGQVTINTPDVDPNRGFINLPSVPVDTEVAQGCNSPNYAQSNFIITGRGGLPPNPKDILTSDAVEVDWVTLNPNIDYRKSPSVYIPTNATPEPIVEATGWVLNAKGEVVFTADAPTTTPRGSWHKSVECRT